MQPGTWQLTQEWVNALLTLISSGIITTVLTWWFNRRRSTAETEKLEAEAGKTKAEAAGLIIDQLNEAFQRALEQRDRLLTRVDTLESNSANLTEQISLALQRIGELEIEVVEWKKRYHELLQRYNRLITWIKKKGLTLPLDLEYIDNDEG